MDPCAVRYLSAFHSAQPDDSPRLVAVASIVCCNILDFMSRCEAHATQVPVRSLMQKPVGRGEFPPPTITVGHLRRGRHRTRRLALAPKTTGLASLTRWGALLTVALTGLIFLSGCGTDGVGSQEVSSLGDAEETFEVTHVGVVVDRVSTSDIRTLPQVTMNAGGQKLIGATLRSVLEASGVSEFERVTVFGLRRGRLMSGEVALTSAEVTDQVLLTVNRRGQPRFASRQVPSERWIVDVALVAVE